MDNIYFHKPFTFNLRERQLFRDDEQIELTSKEYELALYLFQKQEIVVSRKELLESVWETTADIHTRTVDAHVSRLRQKLDLDSTSWEISSIYKHGYSLRNVPQAESREELVGDPAEVEFESRV